MQHTQNYNKQTNVTKKQKQLTITINKCNNRKSKQIYFTNKNYKQTNKSNKPTKCTKQKYA